MRARQEELVRGLCHLFNAIPIWGLLFCGWIWMTLREESRAVVSVARQAMMFHSLMLVVLAAWMILEMLAKVVRVISPALGGVLSHLNSLIILLVLLLYVLICLYGALSAFRGIAFRYPLIDPRD
jgi:uncharacterized Tic20 family protein